jgi:hypothetical protein
VDVGVKKNALIEEWLFRGSREGLKIL